jgi:hypothetical protein
LPIGIQTFREIREENYYYVDKSGMATDLVNTGKYYFLSRPRRFGKSLLLDTFRALFEGSRELFSGLAAETRWDWGKKYPVIRISFSDGVLRDRAELDQRIREILRLNRQALGVSRPADLPENDLAGNLADLIRQASQHHGQRAVVLIDEYDKPILDNITHSPAALEMREGLKNLYSVLKGADEHLKFVFLTGVSKFSKVSLFSGLNNLTDITLDHQLQRALRLHRCRCGQRVCPRAGRTEPGRNPPVVQRLQLDWARAFTTRLTCCCCFDSREFRPYWFETGTPTFLIKLLSERQFFSPDLSRVVATDTLLSTFDVDNIPVEALMFQAGYLTIASVWQIPGRMELTLKYPNLEVQASLNDSLLQSFSGNPAHCLARRSASSTGCCRPTICLRCRRCSTLFTPASRTTGTAKTNSPALRATTPASSTATLPRWGWTSGWKTAPARAASTWRCCSMPMFTCSSSRWWNSPPRAARWRKFRRRVTPTNTKRAASRYT